MGGQEFEPIDLPDDPADARGVLSHQAAFHHGSYGYLVRREIPAAALPGLMDRLRQNPTLRIFLEVPEGPDAHGLSVFGERSGRYPIDPTVLIETERPIQNQAAKPAETK